MSRAIKPDHCGAKNGGGYYGSRADAKRISSKLRRADAKKAARDSRDSRD